MLRYFLSHLLREGEKVVESHQRMSANLRRVLDTTHLAERRRLGELLQEVRQAALAVRDNPPNAAKAAGASVENSGTVACVFMV